MIFFLLTITALTIIPDAIIWNYISPPGNTGWKMLLCIPSLITWMSWFGFKANILSHDIGLRLFFGSLLLLSFPKLVFVVTAIPFGSLAGWMASIIVLMVIVYGFTYGWLRLSVKNETFEFPDLPPSFDGYKILQITDFHIGSFERHPKFIRQLVRIANEQKADLFMANINRNILLNDMDKYAKCIASGGTLLISGFYTEDAAVLIEKAASLGFAQTSRNERNNWCMLAFEKKQ